MITCKSTGEQVSSYSHGYLQTSHWKSRRNEYLGGCDRADDGSYICERCGNKVQGVVQLHHLTYARLGNELDEDLLALCASCHTSLHYITIPEIHEDEAEGFTVDTVHELTGLSADVIRRHQRQGMFDLHDWPSTIKYVHAHMVLAGLRLEALNDDEVESI